MRPYVYEQQQAELMGVVGLMSAIWAWRTWVAVDQAWAEADDFWGQVLWPLGKPPSPWAVGQGKPRGERP